MVLCIGYVLEERCSVPAADEMLVLLSATASTYAPNATPTQEARSSRVVLLRRTGWQMAALFACIAIKVSVFSIDETISKTSLSLSGI